MLNYETVNPLLRALNTSRETLQTLTIDMSWRYPWRDVYYSEELEFWDMRFPLLEEMYFGHCSYEFGRYEKGREWIIAHAKTLQLRRVKFVDLDLDPRTYSWLD